MSKTNSIFIPGNVTSSKNSKQIFVNRKTGNRFIKNSEQTDNYITVTQRHYQFYCQQFISMTKNFPKPLHIEFQFVRKDKRKFDFVNMLQLPLDCMVKNNWIADDDFTNIVPVINPEVLYDKEYPGVLIKPIKK